MESPSVSNDLPADERRGRRLAGVVAIIASVLFVVFAGVLLVGSVWIRPYYIPSGKMQPTIPLGSTVWVVPTNGAALERNDIALFLVTDSDPEPSQTVMGRVVAIEGDTLEIRDCKLFVNGQPADEPFLAPGTCTRQPGANPGNRPITVPDGAVYELGDNRGDSRDSRHVGTHARHAVTHRVVLTSGPPLVAILIAAAAALLVATVAFLKWRAAGPALPAPPT